jgi:hypothetical protein
MTDLRRRWLHPRFVWFISSPWRIALVWAIFMLPLLRWGLPNDRNDDLLFGGADAWPAERYAYEEDLAALQAVGRGADVDLNPLVDDGRIVELTATDADRAEILRRYRLYTRQPDEQIIFRALQNMRQFKLDPQLYQYGGGYLYLVAATVAGGAATGLVHVTGDLGYYLEHPAAFGRFYFAARLVSLVFGALALVAVHKVARRAAGRHAAWLAMLFVAASPTFITAATEAKPHLPSACVLLWAILSALDFAARGGWANALRLGAQIGYAFSLVLTGLAGALLLPAAWFARAGANRADWRNLALAGAVGVILFVALNPYLLLNAEARQSNLQNSTAMYADQAQQAVAGALRVGTLLVESLGWGILLFGIVGTLYLLRRQQRFTWNAVAPAAAILLLGLLLGAQKPAEFARFLLLPTMLLAVAASAVLGRAWRRKPMSALIATALVLFLMPTPAYLQALVTDARGVDETRRLAGEYLARAAPLDVPIAVLQEPAPYAVPPMDFTQRTVFKLPADPPPELPPLPPWLVFTADSEQTHADAWWQQYYELAQRFPPVGEKLSPITWANKATFVYRRTAD